jgi:hypothetical protein
MKQGPTITMAFETAKALPMVPNPSLDLLTCPLEDTSDTYWTNYVDTVAGKSDSDRCGALQPGQTCRCLNPVVPVSRLGHLEISWLPFLGRLESAWLRTLQRNHQLIANTSRRLRPVPVPQIWMSSSSVARLPSTGWEHN